MPTVDELGFPGASYKTSIGLAVTDGTPDATIQKTQSDVRAVLFLPAYAEGYWHRTDLKRSAATRSGSPRSSARAVPRCSG